MATITLDDLRAQGLRLYPPYAKAADELDAMRAKLAEKRREAENLTSGLEQMCRLLDSAEAAALMGEESDYQTLKRKCDVQKAEEWQARRAVGVLQAAIEKKEEELERLRKNAEAQVAGLVRQALHAPAVHRIIQAMHTLAEAAEEENTIRSELARVFGEAAPVTDPSAPQRITRFIWPLGVTWPGRRTDPYSRVSLYEKEAREHGYLD